MLSVWIAIAVLAVSAAFLPARPVAAGVCGNGVPCACGDLVQGVAVLTADVGTCPGLGLGVAAGSRLDCAGHAIVGADLPGADDGVALDEATGAEVRNCRVTGFRQGLRVRGGGGNLLLGNESYGNRYGIDLALGSTGNRIEGNLVRNNRDEGIHVGAEAHDNVIVGNYFLDNKLENVYLLSVRGTRVVGNLVRESGSAGIFVKHSSGSYIADNIVRDSQVQLRGDAWGNVLEDNQLRSDGYIIEAYQEGGAWTYPHDNVVTGGAISAGGTCVQLLGAYDNLIRGVSIDDECVPVAVSPSGGLEPYGNVVELEAAPMADISDRSAVQVWSGARALGTSALQLGLTVHNGPANVPLELYVGLILPDGLLAFFSSPGTLGGIAASLSGLRPMQAAPPGFAIALPRFVDGRLPDGLVPGDYVFFAALMVPGALADGVISAGELAAFDGESIRVPDVLPAEWPNGAWR